jgi:hypothetical protein
MVNGEGIMRKLNIGLVLLLIVLCLVLIFAVNAQRPEQHFEYASVIIDNDGNISWQTETDLYKFVSAVFRKDNFVRNCQDMLIQLSGESEQIGRIRLVKNPLSMLNFLGEHEWELVSTYYAKGGTFLFVLTSGTDSTFYILKRLVD